MNWEIEKVNFQKFIFKNKIIGFFEKPIKLKSGRLSYWYVNWRNISEDVFLLDKLCDYILFFINYLELSPDCFYGVPEGATKLGIITQFKWAKRQDNYDSGSFILSMGRGSLKEHGDPKDRYFLGLPQGKVILLEDVITTGQSLIDSIKKLKELKVNIIAAIGLTNRNELRNDGKSVEELIQKEGVKFYAMSNATDLLPKLKPNKDIALKIEAYFKKYGTKEIKMI
jgi:orotate phosphoribosyltransferase